MNNTTKLPELELKNKPKVLLTEKLLAQISYYHHVIGNKEWSGFLLFKQEGDISEIDKMVLTCDHIHPFNVGTSTLTKFEDYDPFELEEDLGEKVYDYKIACIHTHHDMGAYFSGTDMNDLHENAEGYPFLLSLIVNFKDGGKPVAKIAFIGEDSFSERVLSTNPRLKDVKLSLGGAASAKQVLITCDCIVEYQVPETTKNRLKTLIDTQNKKYETSKVPVHHYGSSQLGFEWDTPKFSKVGSIKEAFGKWRTKDTDKLSKKGKKKKEDPFDIDMSNENLKNFLISVVNCDPLCTDTDLFITLKRLDNNKEFQDETMKSLWLDQIEDNLDRWAFQYFGSLSTNQQNIIFDKCETILRNYRTCVFASDVADVVWNCITADPIIYGKDN